MARLQIIELPTEQQEGTSGDGVVYRTPFVVLIDSLSAGEDEHLAHQNAALTAFWADVPFCRGVMVVPFAIDLVTDD